MSYARRARAAVIVFCAVLLAAGCAGRVPRPAAETTAPRCPLSANLVPSCGALLGVTSPVPTIDSLAAVEASVGRRFDFVYRFHDINDVLPTAEERRLAASGTILHLSIDPRDFSDPSSMVTYADVAAGRYDDNLRQQARGIAGLPTSVFLTFDHEADQTWKSELGSPADFVRAWRHVHDVFSAAGATNVVWVWVVMGWEPTFERALTLWPGNRYVDWISWEAYNQSGCQGATLDTTQYRSFAASFMPFYRWVHEHGPAAGMDPRKPIMISETGTMRYPNDAEREASWYAGIPPLLRAHPQIKAVGLWDHTGSAALCDFRFDQSAATLASVRSVARVPWLNPLAPKG